MLTQVEVTKEMFTTLAEGNLFTLASSGEEADCRVSRWRLRKVEGKIARKANRWLRLLLWPGLVEGEAGRVEA